ncbi:aspartate--tRNA ligase [Obelidium mucronatum]|nr:aspartate--tRNA ligase [Obelidium mucronatum]
MFSRRLYSSTAPTATLERISVSKAKQTTGAVSIAGWLSGRPKRIGASLVFATLRDWTGEVQMVATDDALGRALLAATPESVLAVRGAVRPKTPAGSGVEVCVAALATLNAAAPLPFDTHAKALAPGSPRRPNDETLLRFRFLELRQPWLARNLAVRSRAAFCLRALLAAEGFLDVETPCLFKSTPEGAREFLVPTRTKGLFFALPQSPQQFKQVLMAGGVEKYYQFARCFRDEAVGSDRQQEFTQVDLEMSFVKQQDIMALIERMICKVWKDIMETDITAPFRVVTYHEAMSRYGSDKPDTRYGLEVNDISRFFSPKNGGPDASSRSMMEAIVIPNGSKLLSSKNVSSILNTVLQESFPYYGGSVSPKDLVTRKVKSDNLTSWAEGFASDFTIDPSLYSTLNAQPDDLIFLNQRKPGYFGGHTIMGRTRLITAKALVEAKGLHIPEDQWNFLWVVDFPLFTPVADAVAGSGAAVLESTHHPFTAPMDEDAHLLHTNPELCRAQHYDIVLNGCEIGGGSIRAHKPEMQRYILSQILKLSDEKIETDFGHLLDALRYGCPPHGGIALGFDRFVSILCGASSIREVIAFPKLKGGDLFSGSPTFVSDKTLETYHIKVID